MEKLTQKEKRHTNKVLRLLEKTEKQLKLLMEIAVASDTFPITTSIAWTQVHKLLGETKIRVATRSYKVI